MKRLLSFLLAVACCAGSVSYAPLLAGEKESAADHAVVEALLRLPDGTLQAHPEQRATVLRYLKRRVGTPEYIAVARRLQIFDQTSELVGMLQQVPAGSLNAEAAKLLVQSKQFDSLREAISQENAELATAAVTALGYVKHGRVQGMLQRVAADESANRSVRIGAVYALNRHNEGSRFLLEMAERKQVPEALAFSVADALLGVKDEAIRKAAQAVIKLPASSSSEPLPPVQELVQMNGDTRRGTTVFASNGTCNKCHKVAGEGQEVGPDLSEIGSKLSSEDMFVAILNPSAGISHNYETYSVLDADGQVTTGLLMNRNDEVVTIRNSEGIDTTLPLDDIEEMKVQDVSLMPADLQKTMSTQDLVDLVAYMRTLRRADQNNATGSGTQLFEQRSADDPSIAIAGFDIAEGIQVELFASEPQLLSPTAIDVDHLGRLWICEAVNYRHFRNPENPTRNEGDRILVLEDTDGDGKADKRTVFYQGTDIDSPHGVTVLGDEVFVSAGENVLVFTDADGDLIPESKRSLFTGISGVQHDHGIHAFGAGPDGKLYFNFGNEGKQLKSASGETIVDKAGNIVDDSRNPYQQGMVFRCNPDGSELETLGWNFRNNWEVCLDSFGNLWQSDNDDDGNRGTRINFVMEFGNYGYRDELTGDAWQVKRTGLEGEIPLQHWHLNDPGVVPNILQTGAGSPTGIFFYEGRLLPQPFQNQLLHTDPGPNVVRAYPIEIDGAGYTASIRNLVQGVRDPWFRPVDVCAAPDGSLFVADWYDPGVGGHRMGDVEHGRIFRITPTGHKGYLVPEFDFDSPAGAVAALQNDTLATRYLAQQAIGRMGAACVEPLRDLIGSTDNDRMAARAIWQLGLISSDKRAVVQLAVASPNPQLRIVGVRMARQHESGVLELVEQLKNDASPHVRRELAIALRGRKELRTKQLWVDLAVQHDGQDRWYLEALGIAAEGQWDEYFTAWLTAVGEGWNTLAGRDIVWRCRSPKACQYLAEIIRQTESEQAQQRYFRAFDFHKGESKFAALTELVASHQGK